MKKLSSLFELFLFEDIYQKRKSKQTYSQYKNCLIKTGAYKKAERIIKSFHKKTNDPTVLIDLGDLYIEINEVKKANKQGYKFTYKQLKGWGLKFHKLYIGKPSFDFLVDDRSVGFKKKVILFVTDLFSFEKPFKILSLLRFFLSIRTNVDVCSTVSPVYLSSTFCII